MPNLASLLKSEILRLARKEVRAELESLRKASSRYRSEIAELKRRIEQLERQHGRIAKKSSRSSVRPVGEEAAPQIRFSPQRFAKQRQKLGLSAADMGRLIGVSGQSIYKWEAGKSRPRPQQLQAIAALRKLGKREASRRLEEMRG
jgi:DNA-binding transcriptional regulator YiaG